MPTLRLGRHGLPLISSRRFNLRRIAVALNMKKKPSAVRRRPSDVGVAVLKSFRVIYGSVRQHFRQVQQVCGVSGSQLWILSEVLHAEGIGISDLASKLSIHQSTCSQ